MSEDGDRLTGPPEPVVVTGEDGEPVTKIVRATGEPATTGDPIKAVKLGRFKCARCETIQSNHDGLVDGELREPSECEGCERQGPFVHAGGVTDSGVQAALRADQMWHPPAAVDGSGYGDLWDDVEAYLRDHWDAGDGEDANAVYAGLTAFALSTWFRENLTFVPHLMLLGKTTGGKTRLLNTLARVSYRAVVTASATPASMFRLIEGYDVTYYISEYHGLEYETQRELDAVVRAGQKRGEVVTRAEPSSSGYEPQVFDPFAHLAIATQFTPDDDIINRCIQVRSSPAERDMPATLDEERGLDIRNRLLFARYRLLDSDEWADAEEAAYGYLAEHGIDGRTREKLLGLLTMALVWNRNDGTFRAFIEDVIEQDREAAADSEDARVVEVIRDLAFEQIGGQAFIGDGDPFAGLEIPISDIAERFEQVNGVEISPSKVGHIRSRVGLEKERKTGGTVITDEDLGPKLRQLCEEHNLGWGQDAVRSGDAIESEHQRVEAFVKGRFEPGTEIDASSIAGELGVDPDAAEHGLENLKDKALLIPDGDGGYEVV